MDELDLNVNADHMRRVFGMLTGYVLLPDSNHGYTAEFMDLDLAERVCTLAAGRILWHLLAADAARHGAYDGTLEGALTESRRSADADFAILPGALHLAHSLDEALTLTSTSVIDAGLVVEVASDPTRALGALAYFLRGASTVLHATATERNTSVDELLAAIGQGLAEA